ncbi:MAG TPA: DUF86 domain-containing protein [Thermoanaerobaculia bacterium]|nr:DUF86 domain-containing protein [Thermoanaerobaculia bacterium]
MVDANVITAKLRDLADSVARVRLHCPADPAVLADDRDVLDLVSFNLMLAVQACSDIASHLIADQGWPPPRNIAEGFRQLHEQGVLSEPVAAALGRAVSLRNVIAHGYSKADYLRIHHAAVHGPADLERFAAEVSAWVSRRLGL